MYGSEYEANRLSNLQTLGKDWDPASYPDYGYSNFARTLSTPAGFIPGVGLYASGALTLSAEFIDYKVGEKSGYGLTARGTAIFTNMGIGTVTSVGTKGMPLQYKIGTKIFYSIPNALLNWSTKKVE